MITRHAKIVQPYTYIIHIYTELYYHACLLPAPPFVWVLLFTHEILLIPCIASCTYSSSRVALPVAVKVNEHDVWNARLMCAWSTLKTF